MPTPEAVNSTSGDLEGAVGVMPNPGASPVSPSGSLSDKRRAFFAKHEALFLWLLAPPVLIIAFFLLAFLIIWLGGKGAILELFFRSGQWRP